MFKLCMAATHARVLRKAELMLGMLRQADLPRLRGYQESVPSNVLRSLQGALSRMPAPPLGEPELSMLRLLGLHVHHGTLLVTNLARALRHMHAHAAARPPGDEQAAAAHAQARALAAAALGLGFTSDRTCRRPLRTPNHMPAICSSLMSAC